VKRGFLERLDERGVRAVLAAFFLALAIPAAVLIGQAYSQLKWEAFRGTQLVAEELATRIDAGLRAAIAAEDARSFGDYSFLVVEGDAAANFVQRSALAAFPVTSAIPGALGYFQVDAAGRLTTPLLPDGGAAAATYGIGAEEEAARAARVAELREVLARNRLVRAARDEPRAAVEEREQPQTQLDDELARSSRSDVAETRERAAAGRDLPNAQSAPAAGAATEPPAALARDGQAGFDLLAGGLPVTRSVGEQRGAAAAAALAEADDSGADVDPVAPALALRPDAFAELAADERQKRVEQTLVAEPAPAAAPLESSDAAAPKLEIAVRTFASEVDPFEIGVLDTGHLVLFRNVWRDGQRYIQGALVDRPSFVAAAIEVPYRASSVAEVSRLTVAYQGRTLDTLAAGASPYRSTAQELAGAVLHRARLSPPFGNVELAFTVDALPRAPGAVLLAWVAVALAAVLCGGFFFMYRFAVGQMRLARQQQDFVSAVSHELKTPLTSIRMYGEMLRAGWADDAKKQVYYDYIHSESERLSRLIDNVLQLARLTRNTQHFDLKPAGVAELLDMVRSKVATQIERAGFVLTLRNDTPAGTTVGVDADCFAQVFINLVDNALKFSAAAPTKAVELAARSTGDGVLFTVRDFGPGVPKAQMKRIFELFYRPENELTRETVGTGIGLALVRQLAGAMGARVDVRNCEPGAEFRLHFPRADGVNG
jgi:signal transduction histidine kinase